MSPSAAVWLGLLIATIATNLILVAEDKLDTTPGIIALISSYALILIFAIVSIAIPTYANRQVAEFEVISVSSENIALFDQKNNTVTIDEATYKSREVIDSTHPNYHTATTSLLAALQLPTNSQIVITKHKNPAFIDGNFWYAPKRYNCEKIVVHLPTGLNFPQ